MLSSRFLLVSFLYLFHITRLAAADPRGGDQFCESVRTVTVVHTVTPNQPPPSSSPAKNANPPPVVTQRPGNVNLDGNNSSKSGNTKPSSVSNKNGNPKPSSVTNNNNNNNNNNNTKNGNTKTSSTVLPAATPPATTKNDNQNDGDPSTSLTLDPSVIQNIDGKANGTGQIDSLVSENNFINYCVGKTITNGHQVKTGSCNPTPMGDIPSVDNMPSVKFTFPKNNDTIPANTTFSINLRVNNLVTGTFVNANNSYFAAPQRLVNNSVLGHSHITVQQISSYTSSAPLNPKIFAFFKGVNAAAVDGVLTANVTGGLPPGIYRCSSINAAANHQEINGPLAQRGSFNDVVYFTVTDGEQNSESNPPSSPPVDSTSSTVLPTNVSSSVLSSSLSSPAVSPTSGTPPDVSPTGKNNGGKNNDDSSSEPPVSTSTGGKNGDKEGNSTSSTIPATPTPTAGNDKIDTKDPSVSSPAIPPASTSKGAKDPKSKRILKRSRLA